MSGLAGLLWLLPSMAAAQDIDAIVRELGDKSASVRRDAANNAYNANIGAAAAVPKLLAVLAKESDAEVRRSVVQALGATGTGSPDAAAALVRVLGQDPVAEIRARAADGLASLAGAPEPAVPALVAALADSSDDVRRAAAVALREFPAGAATIVPALVATLAYAPVASTALHSLARFGAAATPALPVLRRLVTGVDTPDDLREGALGVLGAIGRPAAAAAPDCLRLLDHGDPSIRVSAAVALMSFGEDVDAAMKALTAALGYDNARANRDDGNQRRAVIVRAARAVARFGAAAQGDAVLRLALAAADSDEVIRSFASGAFDEVLAALPRANRFDALDSLVAARDALARSTGEAQRARGRQIAATIEELERLHPIATLARRLAAPALIVAACAALAAVLVLGLRRRSAARPRVFISYRRQDSAVWCGRLHDHLVDALGPERVFRDIDSLAPGTLFAERLRESIAACDAFVVLIGPAWLAATDGDGRRRLDDPADFVRLEIESALGHHKPVFPVLVDGAGMPAAAALPPAVARIAASNAIEIGDRHFAADVRSLLTALRSTTGPAPRTAPAPSAQSFL